MIFFLALDFNLGQKVHCYGTWDSPRQRMQREWPLLTGIASLQEREHLNLGEPGIPCGFHFLKGKR